MNMTQPLLNTYIDTNENKDILTTYLDLCGKFGYKWINNRKAKNTEHKIHRYVSVSADGVIFSEEDEYEAFVEMNEGEVKVDLACLSQYSVQH